MIYCLFPDVHDLRVYDHTTFVFELDTGWLRQPLGITFYELSTIGIFADFAWSEANMFGLLCIGVFSLDVKVNCNGCFQRIYLQA